MRADPLLLDLYACPSEPTRWQQVLDKLCTETRAFSAVVQVIRVKGDAVQLPWQAMDRQTARHQSMPQARQLGSQENPRLDSRRFMRGLRRVVRDEQLFDQDDPTRDALQQRMSALGIGRFMGALEPLADGESFVGIALHRAVGDPGDFDLAAEERLAMLAPHMRQAYELGGQIKGQRQELDALHAHLDGLRFGMLLCDPEGRVHWLNRSARSLLQTSVELHLRGEFLSARRPVLARALVAELSMAGPAPRFLSAGQGEESVHLALRRHWGSDGQPLVMLTMTRAGDIAAVPVNVWSQLLGLTAAEAAMLGALLTGCTVEQHAQRRGISAGTARGQLKQVLAKTGTHRQVDLVRLAMSSAASHVMDHSRSVPWLG